MARVDIGRLLGLTGPGAWVLAGLYCVTYLTLAAWAGGPPMQTLEGKVALALILVTAILLVLPWRYPLPGPLVGWALGVVGFSTVAICWHLSPSGWPGWSSWNFGADTFLMFMLALRGRFWWGAIGLVLMSLLTIHWTLTTTGDWWHGFDLTYRQLATYFAGGFFALWLRRTARQIAEFQETEQRRIAAEQARDSTADERRRQLERVRLLAGPALAQIADGGGSVALRPEHGLLEAELRDQIRGRSLAAGPLPAALREARSRGIEIALLDDLREEPPPVELLEPAIAWAATLIAKLRAGSATIRLARADGEPVVTFATADGLTETFSLSNAAHQPLRAS
ncbi:hypothetical protein [Pseudolysinimonas sp.]|uniref:hypothetical protein n=1 Tax=Pseudolysinimonas sp. TaxID=2680009 RepID=UPI00286CE364|nr:hypothetical protein [Pseudolysinimonas sp.]